MNPRVPDIASLLDDLGIATRNLSLMIIGTTDTEVPDVEIVKIYETLPGPNDLSPTLRAALGIVITPPEFEAFRRATQLLSRLRDVHCEKVLLVDGGSGWKQEELRTLGYLAVECTSIGLHCYLYDPEAFNQPREWNNPSDWANPENFRKHRW